MKKFCVGYINFGDNNLLCNVVEANTWKEALATYMNTYREGYGDRMDYLSDDIEVAKEMAFDGDWMFDVTELIGPEDEK